MNNDSIWQLLLDKQAQVLYYAEHPSFRFFHLDKKGKKIWDKKPIWLPICIEFPTKPIDAFQEWINKSGSKDIILLYSIGRNPMVFHDLRTRNLSID